MEQTISDVLRLSDKITLLPIVHGSGDFALEVRRFLFEHDFDCVAVPLPPSFQADVEAAIGYLPRPSLVAQREPMSFDTNWEPAEDWRPDEDDEPEQPTWNYVPIDPCQGVIMALRIALQERIPRAFIDLEVDQFQPYQSVFPDPYALKQVPLYRYAAAVLPSIPPLAPGQPQHRVIAMAHRLRELEEQYESVVFVCSLLDWPWLRKAYNERLPQEVFDDAGEGTQTFAPDAKTLTFMLGELPFITGLYERARADLGDDENLSIDGVKEMLLEARTRYKSDLQKRAKKITPQMLSLYLKYVRNLSLLERRMTPDLYTAVMAAKQIAGDMFALHLAETAREYPYTEDVPYDPIVLGIDRGRFPDGEVARMVNRLAGPPVVWRNCELQKRPEKIDKDRWKMRWNPHSQCSWPPEDEQIELFRTTVMDRAKAIMGIDLARTEKFTTSIKDGIDIRDTLRNWHTSDIYVKVYPPTRGTLDCVVMLFDTPADPRDYPWRTTWYAEHEEESTLAFFGTNYREEVVGPGICQATYGGAMFIYPPRPIRDIWGERALDFTDTLEERLLAAACLHSEESHIALLSAAPPGAGWRKLARRFGKRWIHVPLGSFSASTVAQLRMVHVLNGHQVRSYASSFIRKA